MKSNLKQQARLEGRAEMRRRSALAILLTMCLLLTAGCRRREILIRTGGVTVSDGSGLQASGNEGTGTGEASGAGADEASGAGPGEASGPEVSSSAAAVASGAAENAADPETETECPGIAVHVCGAVQNPGVYYLPKTARAVDAVEAADGFSGQADREWINLAQPLTDGQMLRIPTQEETAQWEENGEMPGAASRDGGTAGAGQSNGSSGTASDSTGGTLININTASAQELMTLSGIGEAKAQKIIEYRENTGGFTEISQIMQVNGIGEKLFAKIRDRITAG